MRRFTARHLNKIDKKGRTSVPAAFRTIVESSGAPIIYLKPNEVEGCIDCLTEAFMAEVERRIDELDIGSEERDDLEEEYFAESIAVRFDTEGRIVIPTDLKDLAEIDAEVVFVGKGSHFEIWEPGRHGARRAERTERRARRTLPKAPRSSAAVSDRPRMESAE